MQPSSISTKRLILFLSLALAALLLLGALGYQYYASSAQEQEKKQSYNASNTPFATLIRDNQYFAEADAAANAGNYDAAKRLYAQALLAATDSVQKGQIEYKIAFLEDQYGDQIRATDLYKQIVADQSFKDYKIVKAYAVMELVELYYKKGDPQITAEIFKDQPYASMSVRGNDGLTYRHLAEYAVSFYPLALPELRIASWYAGNIKKASPVGEATSTYPSLIQHAIQLADADIDRIKADSNAAKLIPSILLRKASLYVSMYQNGLASAEDTEAACKAAISIYVATGHTENDGFARYYYAVFLSQQGKSRISDLQNVVAPLYQRPDVYGTSRALAFFASEKANHLQQKARLIKIASLDPKFKQLLISLGWSASDF